MSAPAAIQPDTTLVSTHLQKASCLKEPHSLRIATLLIRGLPTVTLPPCQLPLPTRLRLP